MARVVVDGRGRGVSGLWWVVAAGWALCGVPSAARAEGEYGRCTPLSTGELPEWCQADAQNKQNQNLLMIRGSALLGLGGILGMGLGYERSVLSWLSIGGGFGVSGLWSDSEDVPHGIGGDILLTMMTTGDSRAAVSLGFSLTNCPDKRCGSLWGADHKGVSAFPAIVLAYRYQPLEGKSFFEVGFGTRGAVMEGLLLSGGIQF